MMSHKFDTKIIALLLCCGLFCLFSCSDTSDIDSFSYGYSFASTENWIVGFADYPVSDGESYELTSEDTILPATAGNNLPALMISGNNQNGDLFMYAKKRLTGLKPQTAYELRFLLQFATNVSNDSEDTGGSPGADVYVKAGASFAEPMVYDDEGVYRINILKGDQSSGGAEAVVLGTFGDSNSQDDSDYRLKSLDNDSNPLTITTDNLGTLWFVVGTDSGYEGTTTIYYHSLAVRIDRH
ncbi:MAG: hypothetical protein GY863_17715 [bacterium]|nr:hypothetical protein [bacterium]